MQVYRRTQIAYPYILLSVALTGMVILFAVQHQDLRYALLGGIPLLLGVAFSSMTVGVDDQSFYFYFGPKLFRKVIALREIQSIETASSTAFEGWGIRVTGEGMLYNATGFKVIRLHLRSGKAFRVGTEEPEHLVEVTRAAMALQP
jgi:hypothetical protein